MNAHELAMKARSYKTVDNNDINQQKMEENVMDTLVNDQPVETGKNDLAVKQASDLSISSEIADFYQQNASVGAENLGGDIPTLSIVQTNSKGLLADGKRPELGYLYYKPTQQQFTSINANIVIISRGYYAEAYKAEETKKEPQWNQIITGLTDTDLPFMMFFKGVSLKYLWDFGKVAGKYTHAKPVPTPLMALNVEITTTVEKTKFGDIFVPNIEIVKVDGNISRVMDMERLQQLREYYDYSASVVSNLIANKSTEDKTTEAVVASDVEF